ncbi:hypothetical protein CXB51_026606 [Gossypium anomalum]|uniref:Uncharacterized protein n=1 Tax=Gossypium anomalum TaxID=47600 RepID=A0A8J5YHV3_9ROSI|nr:hypothetical protein CXB51_026606 [Gossypium anomalum]
MADHELLGGPPRPCHESVTSIVRCGILRPSLNEFEDGISPTCSTIKRGGAFWFLSLRHGQWPNPKGSATFRSTRESQSTPQAVNRKFPFYYSYFITVLCVKNEKEIKKKANLSGKE